MAVYGKYKNEWNFLMQKATSAARKNKEIPFGYSIIQSLRTGNTNVVKSIDFKSRTNKYPLKKMLR